MFLQTISGYTQVCALLLNNSYTLRRLIGCPKVRAHADTLEVIVCIYIYIYIYVLYYIIYYYIILYYAIL